MYELLTVYAALNYCNVALNKWTHKLSNWNITVFNESYALIGN